MTYFLTCGYTIVAGNSTMSSCLDYSLKCISNVPLSTKGEYAAELRTFE